MKAERIKLKANKPFHLSPTSIAVFKQCRQRYKYLYIDKLGTKFGKPRPYFTMANHVHSTLKELLLLQPVEIRNAAAAEELLRKNWQRYRLGFRDIEEETRWMEKALAQLRIFVKTYDMNAQPMMMEEMVEAEISPGLVLRGRIDRVDKLPDGSLHIIDYKTGNMTGEIDWEQLELHALILSKRLSWPVSTISYLYLDNSIIKTTNTSDADLRKVHWRFLTVANTMRQEKQFCASISSWCRDCDFISICPGKSEAQSSVPSTSQRELWNDQENNQG